MLVLNLPEFILFLLAQMLADAGNEPRLPGRGRVLWLDQTHVVVHRTPRVGWGVVVGGPD